MPLHVQESPNKEALIKKVNAALGLANVGDVSLLMPGLLEDGTTKLLVRSPHNKPIAVVLCSPEVSPDIVGLAMQRAGDARAVLGPDLGRVVVQPIDEGEIEGLTYTILPYCRPLTSSRIRWRWQRRGVARVVLPWLRRLTEQTMESVPAEDIEERFDKPLAHLTEMDGMDPRLCEAAADARQRLRTGEWVPKHVLMHGDLWKGNILLDDRVPSPSEDLYGPNHVMIIDWPGSERNGYALFDLVKLADSIGVRGKRFRQEILWHTKTLECAPQDARCHLLSALAHTGMNLNYFPFPQYKEMAVRLFDHLG